MKLNSHMGPVLGNPDLWMIGPKEALNPDQTLLLQPNKSKPMKQVVLEPVSTHLNGPNAPLARSRAY